MASLRIKRICLAAIAIGAMPCAAHAHLVQTGFGDYYDGIAHLALSPQDTLLVVAMALFAGQRGAPASRATLIALPAAWLIGGLLGSIDPMANWLSVTTTLTSGVIGLCIAFNLNLQTNAIVALAIAFGLMHGYANGSTLTTGTGQTWLGIVGIASAILVAETLMSAVVVRFKYDWTRIVVRVAGSWLVAIGLLMLGWLARGSLKQI